MNANFETLKDEIVTTHDIDTLKTLRRYNDYVRRLLYNLVIEDTKRPIFDGCREYINDLVQLETLIEEQIKFTLTDMERSQPADED